MLYTWACFRDTSNHSCLADDTERATYVRNYIFVQIHKYCHVGQRPKHAAVTGVHVDTAL